MVEIQCLVIVFDKDKLFNIRDFIDLDIVDRINNIIFNNL